MPSPYLYAALRLMGIADVESAYAEGLDMKGDADKILDYFGGSPCIHTKTAFGRLSCT